MMKVTDIHKRFGKQEVLKGIDLDVAKGEVVVLLGPSGSGKTTFLRCLNFLERADQGVIQLGETTTTLHKASKKEIVTHQRQTAMVFQNYALFQNKTAKENIMMPLIVTKKQSKETALRTAEALLDQVGLSERQDFYPSQLSGGQQQRIGIARALALNPKVIL
ncbi:amino acid ABC transporter ATP-binding protein, partial [Enterococcus faecalis]|uniref:amino acid ABC transporter ATP-binding protein n=1 Tax=Enterococcus faecalis TaxID=1351 RepID=UPI000FBABCE3